MAGFQVITEGRKDRTPAEGCKPLDMLVRLQIRQRFCDKSNKAVPRRLQFSILSDARQVSRIDAKLEVIYQILGEPCPIWRRSSVGPLVVPPDPGT